MRGILKPFSSALTFSCFSIQYMEANFGPFSGSRCQDTLLLCQETCMPPLWPENLFSYLTTKQTHPISLPHQSNFSAIGAMSWSTYPVNVVLSCVEIQCLLLFAHVPHCSPTDTFHGFGLDLVYPQYTVQWPFAVVQCQETCCYTQHCEVYDQMIISKVVNAIRHSAKPIRQSKYSANHAHPLEGQ